MSDHASKKSKKKKGTFAGGFVDDWFTAMATTQESDDTTLPDMSHQNGQAIKVEPPVDAQNVTTSSLSALQSKDSRQIMDVVDRLRRSGLSGELQLPQLVVCGDQSSGKSSVLEAITEIPFPRKENLCTRFATEIVLRRAPAPSISTKIIPDKFRSNTEKKRLEHFKSSIIDFGELPNLIEEATSLMAGTDDGSGTQHAFFRDVLSIEIAGPGRPHLTVVDLPGLIHAETKYQSKEDVELIRALVQEYIEEKRTIILAVVSAKNDYANQIILKKCREVDPKGHRTLGLITKPDYLEPGSEGEQAYIELAQNRDVTLALGWHMLKNRSPQEMNSTFSERNTAETVFFSKGRYRELPTEMLGIAALRLRLSQLLYKHLKTELPALQQELNQKHREVSHDLGLLGEKRSTSQEQRRFLTIVSGRYKDIVDSATKGHYEDEFFGIMNTEESLEHESNMRRLRAVVQHLNLQFATLVRKHGQKTKIEDDFDAVEPVEEPSSKWAELDGGYAEFTKMQDVVPRDVAIQRVSRILVRSRGRELPCTFNPLLISQLFWNESENWKTMAAYHIERVADVCSLFVRTAMAYTVSSDVAENLLALKVEAALRERLCRAEAELKTIIEDTKRHPITYDPRYVDTVQKRRNKVYMARMEQLRQQKHPDQPDINDTIVLPQDQDTEKISAEEALDDSLAYYEEEVKYFVSVVTKQIIERYLLTDLADDTLSPLVVSEMDDGDIAFVAAEPDEITRERESLEARKATLEKGQQTFKSALGLFKGSSLK